MLAVIQNTSERGPGQPARADPALGRSLNVTILEVPSSLTHSVRLLCDKIFPFWKVVCNVALLHVLHRYDIISPAFRYLKLS